MITFREYKCTNCGYEAWAMDHLLIIECHICGAKVETKEIDLTIDHLRKESKEVNSS